MTWLLLLSLVTAVPPPPPGVQGFVSAEDLILICAAESEAEPLCLGYLVGGVDQVLARQSRRPAARRTVCLPADLTAEAMREAVMRRIARDPANRPQAAAEAVRAAVEAEYPCPIGRAP